MLYDDLLIKFGDSNPNLIIAEANLPVNKGRIKGNKIAIRRSLSTKEKGCVLAEEIGHYYTTSGNILDQSKISNRKQELKARMWAYDKLVGLSGIIGGYQARCQNRHELAEYLNVTEKFLQDAIDCYKEKYGIAVELDGYIIIFDPSLAVIEKI